MDLQLIVLAGAKHGTCIPLKKSKFVIGRASECTLRAGSEAISRRHCAIVRGENGWTVRDLGSRNGTILNGSKIEAETPLKPGDELAVGPLKFRVEKAEPKQESKPEESKEQKEPQAKQKTKTPKQPPVKDVNDVVQRTAAGSGDSATEDDISRWLLGTSDAEGAMKETRTLSMEETGAIAKAAAQQVKEAPAKPAEEKAEKVADDPSEEVLAEESQNGKHETKEGDSDAAGKSGWSWLKFGKGKGKKQPGKLPKRDSGQTKDSREAAADILREMTRRH